MYGFVLTDVCAEMSDVFAKKPDVYAKKSDVFAKRSDVCRQEVRCVWLTSYEVSTLIVRSKHVERT